MRRCLHSLLVGVLTFSMAVDAARACGPWRCRRCPPACQVQVVHVPAWDGCVPDGSGGCGAVFAGGWACGPVWPAITPAFVACEEIPCGTPVECCAGDVVLSVPAAAATGGGASVVAPVTPAAPAPAAAAEPVEPSPVASAVPELEPVEPVSATEPAAEDASARATAEPDIAVPVEEAAPEPALEVPQEEPGQDAAAVEPPGPVPPVVAPEPPPAPPEPAPPPNVFEEAAEGGESAADALPNQPASEPAAAPVPPADDAEPVAEPDGQPAGSDVVPVDDEPAAAPDVPVEPATDAEPAAAEPLRRWIDHTASYAVVGRLVDVSGATVAIQRADGRHVTVPLERLSRFDRDYVAEAGPRLAARPRAWDTARR